MTTKQMDAVDDERSQVDRTTYEYVNGRTNSGSSCTNCGTSYRRCTEKLYGRTGRTCCETCLSTDTHDERTEVPNPKGDPVQPAFGLTHFTITLASPDDKEAQAIQIALAAFRDLSPVERRRVLDYVHARITDGLQQ